MAQRNGSTDLYIRISQDRSGAGAGRARQEKECRTLAAQLGLTVRAVHADTESATDPLKVRKGFEGLLAAGAETIVIWHEDRLIRTIKDLERVISLGVNVHPVKSGRLDLSTPTGRAVARTVVAWSQYEIEHRTERVRAANLQRAEAGVPWTSGSRLFGYERDRMSVVPVEAELVREAFRDVLAGVSCRAILRAWAKLGVTTTEGNPWSSRCLTDMLKRPIYAGRRTYRGVDVGPSLAPALIDPDTFAAVQVLLADPARRTTDNQGRGAMWLLSGIARCGHDGCGGRMLVGAGRGARRLDGGRSEYRTLKCVAARHLERRAEPIEDHVVGHVLALLRRPDAAKLFRLPSPDLAPLRARAGELRAQREKLAADLTVEHDFAAARDKRLREELARVESEVAAKSAGSALRRFASGAEPRGVWTDMTLDERRAVVRELVDVVVLPVGHVGRRAFDPLSVLVTPKS